MVRTSPTVISLHIIKCPPMKLNKHQDNLIRKEQQASVRNKRQHEKNIRAFRNLVFFILVDFHPITEPYSPDADSFSIVPISTPEP